MSQEKDKSQEANSGPSEPGPTIFPNYHGFDHENINKTWHQRHLQYFCLQTKLKFMSF